MKCVTHIVRDSIYSSWLICSILRDSKEYLQNPICIYSILTVRDSIYSSWLINSILTENKTCKRIQYSHSSWLNIQFVTHILHIAWLKKNTCKRIQCSNSSWLNIQFVTHILHIARLKKIPAKRHLSILTVLDSIYSSWLIQSILPD